MSPTVPRASVASAAASQTFPSMAPTASPLARRYDITEGTPPNASAEATVRHPIEIPEVRASRLHPNFPPSCSTPKMNRRIHPAYPAQQPHSRGRRLEYHDLFPLSRAHPRR
ncbi:hypothetical protein EDB85DRAFT_2281489 [Lactarius pseudohatsudake]|nr:hypothetical protein EDB85DRAFT_2281489 [Lactarius pseudohatsudake]